ncbi:MAG: GntR family transcriptional regulator [Thermomicrobiales bacterium]
MAIGAGIASDSTNTVKDRYSAVGERFTKDRALMRSREIAYEAVKDAILHGILEPRERLIEERLGDALGLSRTPVREALAILEHEGLIESVPYKGLMVKRITVEEFLRMYEAHGVIEPALAQAAVHNVTAVDLRVMEAFLDEAEQAIPDDVTGHLAACRAFLRRLGECAGNPYLTRILISIEERSDVYLIHTQHRLPPERMLAAVGDRRAILEAVRGGDPAAAALAARAHAEAVRVRWRDLYVEDGS